MTEDEFWSAYRMFIGRRPFRPFLVEFASGSSELVPHPESIDHLGANLLLYRGRRRAQSLFPAESVCRMLDVPEPDIDEISLSPE